MLRRSQWQRTSVRRRSPEPARVFFRSGHSFIAYSKPEEADQPGKDYDAPGPPESLALQQRGVPQTADFYLCGPPAFPRRPYGRVEVLGCPLFPHSLRGIRRRNRSITPGIASSASTDAASAGRRSRHWPQRFLHSQWPHRAVGLAVCQSSRICRGLRCSRQVVLPDGRLPHVRVRADRRRWSTYAPEPLDRPEGGKCFDLLFPAAVKDRIGSLIVNCCLVLTLALQAQRT